jgi:hypothetical protein
MLDAAPKEIVKELSTVSLRRVVRGYVRHPSRNSCHLSRHFCQRKYDLIVLHELTTEVSIP